jgi:hypothetical protein
MVVKNNWIAWRVATFYDGLLSVRASKLVKATFLLEELQKKPRLFLATSLSINKKSTWPFLNKIFRISPTSTTSGLITLVITRKAGRYVIPRITTGL